MTINRPKSAFLSNYSKIILQESGNKNWVFGN
jgi:hypothetical protein